MYVHAQEAVVEENGEICSAYLDEIIALQKLVKVHDVNAAHAGDDNMVEEKCTQLHRTLQEQENEVITLRATERTLTAEIERLTAVKTHGTDAKCVSAATPEDATSGVADMQSQLYATTAECDRLSKGLAARDEQLRKVVEEKIMPHRDSTTTITDTADTTAVNTDCGLSKLPQNPASVGVDRPTEKSNENAMLVSELHDVSSRLKLKEMECNDIAAALRGVVAFLTTSKRDVASMDRLPQQQMISGVIIAVKKLINEKHIATEQANMAAKYMRDLASVKQERSTANKNLTRAAQQLANVEAEKKKLWAENRELRRQMEDLPTLHQSLADARLALAEAQHALQRRSADNIRDPATVAPEDPGGSVGGLRRRRHPDVFPTDHTGTPAPPAAQTTSGLCPTRPLLQVAVASVVALVAWLLWRLWV